MSYERDGKALCLLCGRRYKDLTKHWARIHGAEKVIAVGKGGVAGYFPDGPRRVE